MRCAPNAMAASSARRFHTSAIVASSCVGNPTNTHAIRRQYA
jgi:hypothetical protein